MLRMIQKKRPEDRAFDENGYARYVAWIQAEHEQPDDLTAQQR
jgi:hypothetical protein